MHHPQVHVRSSSFATSVCCTLYEQDTSKHLVSSYALLQLYKGSTLQQQKEDFSRSGSALAPAGARR